MKYTNSKDGVQRTSIQIIIRLDRLEVAGIRRYLAKKGESFSDKAVKEFVASCTELDLPEDVYEDEEDESL